MAGKTLVLLWISLHSIVASEVTQMFPNVQFVKAGETAIITCKESSKSAYVWLWYKEKEDGGLQGVTESTCFQTKNPSPEKYTADCNKNVTMKIKDVTKSDSGTYYCSQGGLKQTFHVASTLFVTEIAPSDPTLSILAPVAERYGQPEETVLLCIALNWSDTWSPIKWSVNESLSNGWQTLDPDGFLKSLITIHKSQEPKTWCYIKNLHDGRKITTHLPAEENSSEDKSQCYIGLYVGLGFVVLLLLIHQIFLANKRRTLSREKQNTTSQHRQPGGAVRFYQENETVTYAAVKG